MGPNFQKFIFHSQSQFHFLKNSLDKFSEMCYPVLRTGNIQRVTRMQKITALYARLSKDDESQGDSNSIQNQKIMLEQFAREHYFSNIVFYADDGYSGVGFERPQIQKLFDDVQAGLVGTVIVKDLSRFGRNHLMVGYYTEVMFAEYGVRFISILDNVDSANGEDDLTPFKNILNEMYAKDISQKQRASVKARGLSGKRLAPIPPIGYIKDAAGVWHIDEQQAKLVQRIYRMYLDGTPINRIASILTNEGVPTVRGKTRWNPSQITRILTCPEYCGDMVNFKTRRVSFKNKKQILLDESEHVVFRDTQPPIIDRTQWQLVQDKRKRVQRTVSKVKHEPAIFAGFLYCGECGSKFYPRQTNRHYSLHYICSGYAKKTVPCTIHTIQDHVLRRRVLHAIRSLLQEYRNDDAALVTRLQGFRENSWQTEIAEKQKTVENLQAQIRSLEYKLRQSYEDKLSGVLSEDAFQVLSDQIIEERRAMLAVKEQLDKEIVSLKSNSVQIHSFIEVLHKYRDENITEITQSLLLDFVDKILVHDTGGKRTNPNAKPLDIYFRAVGCIDIFTK